MIAVLLVSVLLQASGFTRPLAGQLDGSSGYLDGVNATAAFNEPGAIQYASGGRVLVADAGNGAVREVDVATANVSTLVPPASLSNPRGIALDESRGLLYISDTDLHVVRVLNLSSMELSVLAGEPGEAGLVDAATPTDARFRFPHGMAMSEDALTLFVADRFNHRIRSIALDTGVVSTLPATVRYPNSVVAADGGKVFVTTRHCVLEASGALAVLLAGDCLEAGVEDGPLGQSRLYRPEGLAVDAAPPSVLFIADSVNHRVRALNLSSGVLTTVIRAGLDPGRQFGVNIGESAMDLPMGMALPPGARWTNASALVVVEAGSNSLRLATATCEPACENNGVCVGLNDCLCPSGFAGDACETGVCTTPCTGGTVCFGANECRCPTGYTGAGCATPICDPVCENGACTAPDVCTCPAGLYEGALCEVPVCSQVQCENGACTSPNNCTCDAGWSGSNCTVALCDPTCANNGTCAAPDTCVCTTGWEGPACTQAVCAQPCLNNGTCVAPDTCACATGWEGFNCTTPSCPFPCVNGVCDSPSSCSCDSGWTGEVCDVPICNSVVCQNGGNCTGPETCTCTSEWSGTNCTEPVCSSPSCSLGEVCIAPNTCQSACLEYPCQNGAPCVGLNNCTCVNGWLGIDCSLAICSPRCVQGACTAPNFCSCNQGWSGASCNEPLCAQGDCLNGGVCVRPNTCECETGWVNSTCDQPVCTGGTVADLEDVDIAAENADQCVNGNCISPQSCNCSVGWTGSLCEQAVCAQQCINGGACTAPDTCTCAQGFGGDDCSRVVSDLSQFVTSLSVPVIAVSAFFVVAVFAWCVRVTGDRRRARIRAIRGKRGGHVSDSEEEDSEFDEYLTDSDEDSDGPG